MRICGIIAEYNPFHQGHEKHIAETRKKTGADFVVCAMSGHFVQRGEPALFDKWTRALCAVLGGADAVIELPLLYAVQSAEGFAAGGVAILDAAGADALSFGCETDDMDALSRIAGALCNETASYQQSLRDHLSQGKSYPLARMYAAFPDAPDAFSMPNAILGIEYLKALMRSGSRMEPFAIRRIGEAYHSADIHAPLPSATAIRTALSSKQNDLAWRAMPPECARFLSGQVAGGLLPVFPDCYDRELIFILRRGGTAYLKSLPDVSEGLENRIYQAALTSSSREEVICKVKTKRYTYTRISRILLFALLGITKDMIEHRNLAPVDHIRLLAAKNADVLSALSIASHVPVITGSVASSPYPGIDVSASDVYALSQAKYPFSASGRDFTEKMILL